MSQMQQLLNRNQAASILGINPQTLAVWACTKRYFLLQIKVGRRSMYAPGDIDAFIAQNRVVGGAA